MDSPMRQSTGRLQGTGSLGTGPLGTGRLTPPPGTNVDDPAAREAALLQSLIGQPQPTGGSAPPMGTDRLSLPTTPAPAPKSGGPSLVEKIAGWSVLPLTSSAAYIALKDGLGLRGTVLSIQDAVSKVQNGATAAGGDLQQGIKAYSNEAQGWLNANDTRALSNLDKVGEGLRVVGALGEAFQMPTLFEKAKKDPNILNLSSLGAGSLMMVRGADSVVKLAKGMKFGFLGAKLGPGISAAAGALDIPHRIDLLAHGQNGKPLDTANKLANSCYLAGDIADTIGAFPPAWPITRIVSSGLWVIGLGLQNYKTIEHEAEKVGSEAKHIGESIVDFGKKIFGGL